jgi:DNA invertase Pin-like site-specific DNA recombinase
MKKAVGYARVSTVDQANEGVSLETQVEKIKAYCQLNDLTLAGVFVDAGISGAKVANRPELQSALQLVCSERSTLVVYSLSRLCRSTRHTIEIAESLGRVGSDLVSLTEKIDTSSASGKMLFRLLSVLGEFERDIISERTKAALAHKKSKGERVGEIPIGYNVDSKGSMVSAPDELQTIKLICELHESGQSLRGIADELTRKKIATKKGGERWKHSTIQRVLKRAA